MWSAVPVDDFWRPNNPLRANPNKAVVKLSPGSATEKTLSSSDEHWEQWRRSGAWYLVVFAYIPGAIPATNPARDSRRAIVPIDACVWEGRRDLTIRVKDIGLQSDHPVEPAEMAHGGAGQQ
jgi:hypothetical protein